jgi:acetoin utilization protein AcuB
VNGSQLLGVVTEEELHEIRDTSLSIADKPLKLLNPFVTEDTHIYDVIRLFNQFQLSLIPVLDINNNFLGSVTASDLIKYMAEIFSLQEPGGTIVLEISNRNNSLSHMSQIVEADNAQILSSYVKFFPESTKMEVTLKINKMELSGITASFERYNYEVKAVYNTTKVDNGSEDRYNSLMNYLNV